jgi:hypothetical protein
MKTFKHFAVLLTICSLGTVPLFSADSVNTNTTVAAPTGSPDINANTTTTITPPPTGSADSVNSDTTVAAPTGSSDINTNTTTTITPPPTGSADSVNSNNTVAAPTGSPDINSNTTTTTAPPPVASTYYNVDATVATTPPAMPGEGNHADADRDDVNKLFQDMEFSVDVFGTLALGRHTIDHISEQRIYHNSQLGIGAGGIFFFSRYVGIGGEAYSANTTGSFVDSTSGNIFLRYPIEKAHLAPYIFGGGGYDFEGIKQGFGQAGVGLEIRIVRYVGVFADARYVFAAESNDYGVGRAGIRVTF